MNAEEKLERIAAIFSTKRNMGDLTVNSDALLNLDGAIADIERTREVDDISLRTLKGVREQLREIAELLGLRKGRR